MRVARRRAPSAHLRPVRRVPTAVGRAHISAAATGTTATTTAATALVTAAVAVAVPIAPSASAAAVAIVMIAAASRVVITVSVAVTCVGNQMLPMRVHCTAGTRRVLLRLRVLLLLLRRRRRRVLSAGPALSAGRSAARAGPRT
jgi:hypothetical protein